MSVMTVVTPSSLMRPSPAGHELREARAHALEPLADRRDIADHFLDRGRGGGHALRLPLDGLVEPLDDLRHVADCCHGASHALGLGLGVTEDAGRRAIDFPQCPVGVGHRLAEAGTHGSELRHGRA